MFPYSRAARVRHIYLSCFICLGVGYISYNAILALWAIFAHRKLKTTPSKNIFISSCKQVFFSILTQSDKYTSWGFVCITPILSKICTDMTKFWTRKQLYDFNRSNIVQCCRTFWKNYLDDATYLSCSLCLQSTHGSMNKWNTKHRIKYTCFKEYLKWRAWRLDIQRAILTFFT